MFIRIVKMRFNEDKIEAFLTNFEAVKQHIRNFEGNQFLELYQDKNDQRIFFTYSYWENEQALENYRNSILFNEVWSYTKTLFSDKPEAWSVDRLVTLSQELGDGSWKLGVGSWKLEVGSWEIDNWKKLETRNLKPET